MPLPKILHGIQYRPRLLLIEDSEPLAEATAEFLRDAGLEVGIAKSGEEGLEMAILFRPEIVLCDICLPGLSGLGVARALRENPATKDVLFALHTAMSDMHLSAFDAEIYANEVNLYLSKPLTGKKLDRLLAAHEAFRHSPRSQPCHLETGPKE